MKKTGILGLLLAFAMLAVTACSPALSASPLPAQATPAQQSATAAPTGENVQGEQTEGLAFPLTQEKVELTFFAIGTPGIEDMNTNWQTQMYEEMTNVHINWDWAVGAEAGEKLNLSLASGSYPDVYWNSSLNTTQQAHYGNLGVFLPLNDLIYENTYYLKEILDDRADILQAITDPQGNIYSLFRTSGQSHADSSQKMWVYKPWLEKLGMAMPTTTQEYYDMLVAFRDNDMNGNGDPDDEYPLIGSTGGSQTDISGFLMNPFILNDGGKRLNLENGKLIPAYIQEQWREGLRYINRLYSENLIARESFVQDVNQLISLTTGPDNIVVGSVPAFYPGSFVNTSVLPSVYTDYGTIPPLKNGADAKAVTPRFYSDIAIGTFVITSACKEPALAMKWVDYWYSEDGTILTTWGREGVEFEWVDVKNIMGTSPSYQPLLTYDKPQNFFWRGLGPRYFTSELRNSEVYDKAQLGTAIYEASLPYESCWPQELLPQFQWPTAEQSTQLANMETVIGSYVDESTAAFIIGSKSIDSDWESYINELNNMGLEDYVALNQEILDATLR